jgi:hypothetical protein
VDLFGRLSVVGIYAAPENNKIIIITKSGIYNVQRNSSRQKHKSW